ncbi:unnamed protein product [Peronospora farinosa]|uniref:Serine protease n=1 Tax=Peronospora farinosa TaxID=134698 RepID=A0ABN8BZD8_9STRA|nr:unnamed protein product [Peronospora farinosa]
MQWAFALLLAAVATVDVVAQTTGQQVEILIGAGCKFSNYSTLPIAIGKEPSYLLKLDPGLGKGIYLLHFTQFNLPETDVLVVRASNDPITTPPVAILAGKNATGTFYSTAISGDGVKLELFKSSVPDTTNSTSCRGFAVDGLLFSPKELTRDDDDDSVNKEIMLAKSHSVARLSIIKENGMLIAYCTGWLLGCDGHLITNQHCIGSTEDAINTKVEFFAQATTVSEALDYAVVRLDINNSVADYAGLYEKTGGYLQLRGSGAVLEENIYIPQHPLGYGKRIAWLHNGQPGRVESLTVTGCRKNDVGYYVDTQEGSSGSPILATRDNKVIAMHHCGDCLNGAIPSQAIIEDLTAKGVLPKCSVAEENSTTTSA